MPDVDIREMIRARHQRRPIREISLGGEVIGWIFEIHIRRTVNPFYRAVGVHRATGRKVELERSTDREERIETVRAFWVDPLSSPQHLPRYLQAR